MQELHDSDIIQQVIQGNTNAFNIILERYGSKVYSLCFRLTNNETDAQDLTQNVFIKAFKNLNQFRFKSSLMTWFHSIAVHDWINIYRRRKILRFFSLDRKIDTDEAEISLEIKDTTMDVENHVEKQAAESRIQKLLAELEPEYRTVIILRFVEDKSYEEIAAICGCNVGTVGSRLSRGIEALRKKLGKSGC